MFITGKTSKRVFLFTRPMRGVLGEGWRWGGPQRGGPSWRSWQMILPPLQMQPSRPPHEEQGQWLGDKACLYASKVERQWPWELGCAQARPPKEHYIDQSHRRRTRRHRTAPRNQTRSRQRAARPTRSAGHAEHDGTCPKRKKREHREAKRRSAEKNKSKSMEK